MKAKKKDIHTIFIRLFLNFVETHSQFMVKPCKKIYILQKQAFVTKVKLFHISKARNKIDEEKILILDFINPGQILFNIDKKENLF